MTPLELANLANDALVSIELGDPLEPAEAAWLKSGLEALLSGNDIREALYIKRGHGKLAEKAVALALRDEYVADLVCEVGQTRALRIISGHDPAPENFSWPVEEIRRLGVPGKRQIERIVSAQPENEIDVATLNRLCCRWG